MIKAYEEMEKVAHDIMKEKVDIKERVFNEVYNALERSAKNTQKRSTLHKISGDHDPGIRKDVEKANKLILEAQELIEQVQMESSQAGGHNLILWPY